MESAQERLPKRKRKKNRDRAVTISVMAIGAVIAICLALAAGFGFLRWGVGNDKADIQGTWYLAGTNTPIEITEDRICLTKDVSYPYTMNSFSKNIEFSFANLKGQGFYRFSLDRDDLAIFDGEYSFMDTISRDFGWTIEACASKLSGRDLLPVKKGEDGVTLLTREPAEPVEEESAEEEPAEEEPAEDEAAPEDELAGEDEPAEEEAA